MLGVRTESRMCFAIIFVSSITSRTVNNRSNREIMVEERLICSDIERYWSKRPYFGFAAARIAVRAENCASIPAFATLTVCCSIASCMAERSSLVILSNSSIQAIPRSASTSAPASRLQPPSPKSSLTAVAVRPAPVAPLPEVKTPFGASSFATYCRISDLPVAGSPRIKMWESPLILPPSSISIRGAEKS
ncbi:hypothetical protein BMS3Abin16_01793 [archaeon BMS3Abin16]|nr:hypothetical protein BMS3Abin16_01793 [archaeon BMS3Abin16]